MRQEFVIVTAILCIGALTYSWMQYPKFWLENRMKKNITAWERSGEYVAMCLAIRDQHEDLPEWLQHHYYHHKIRRFYIMDDGSQRPHNFTKDFGIPNKFITHRYFPERIPGRQNQFYKICHKDYGENHRWIALFDVDEFLEVKSPMTLNTFLKNYEEAGGIGVNWEMYGSSGHLTRPVAGVRKSYTKCIPNLPNLGNSCIKSILNTAYFLRMGGDPHTILTSTNRTTVDEHGNPIKDNGPFRVPITKDILALHHYILKSREEFEAKLIRGSGDGTRKKWALWNETESFSTENCTSLTSYVP